MPQAEPTATPHFRVNFLIVGAQKSGTTALASFLGWHPEICIPPLKEMHFFDTKFDRHTTDEARELAYHAEFTNYAGERIIGEATPSYLFFPYVAERIHRYNPQMKLIGILRNPVERAISQHAMELSRGRETLPLGRALALEGWRIFRRRKETNPGTAKRWHAYLRRGFYSRQIEHLWRYFPREQTRFILSEDLAKRHDATLAEIQRFLGVEKPDLIAPQERVFEGEKKSPPPAWITKTLHRVFRREIDRLETLLNRDLSAWKR